MGEEEMTPEERRTFNAIVDVYADIANDRSLPKAERTSALSALSSVINKLGWWKEALDELEYRAKRR